MLNSELPDNSAIAILGISLKINENIHSHKYTGVLKIAKSRTSSKCSLTDEWINKMWYISIVEYYLTIKKFSTDPCSIMDAAWKEAKRKRQVTKDHICINPFLWNV